ncbi:activating signal cointegrator 1 complex subunit 2 homolog [Procambarus clarkii]|uniref:activating signal cointegrator 1 complex subunit 2 homolog n=1 Tax=Procambarus clarkii TaxID=6728 RepID=UPI00374392FF
MAHAGARKESHLHTSIPKHNHIQKTSRCRQRAGAGKEALGREETTEGDEVDEAEAGGRAHPPQPRQLRETDGRRQEKQAPPLQQHPRPPRNQPAADAPLQPPNDEDPKQESPGPQSSQEGQTYQGQTERPPKPQQEPRQYQDRVRIRRGNPHTQTSRESHPPEKPKGPQHEERHCRLPRGPQHHTGNRSLSGPDKRSVEGALDTKSWTEKGS